MADGRGLRHSAAAAATVLAVLSAGCGNSVSRVVRAYYSGDLEKAREVQSRRLADTSERHRNRALEELRMASVAIASGDHPTALSALSAAISRMEENRRREDPSSPPAYSRSASRPFIGHPYERTMAYLYMGLLKYADRNYAGALEEFRKAVAADVEGSPSESAADWPLLYLMEGKCRAHLGEKGGARIAFEDAGKLCEKRRMSRDIVEPDVNIRANLAILVEMGRCPAKVRWGEYGEVVSIEPRPQEIVRCMVSIDGGRWVSVPVFEDIEYQASTHGGKRVAGVIYGRPVVADALAAAGFGHLVGSVFVRRWEPSLALAMSGIALLAASTAIDADSDVRTWEMLPARIAYIGFDLPPGLHSVRLEFYGPDGNRRPEYGVAFPAVEAPERDETLLLVRALPRRP
ncbi:MAG: hypothetical protein N3A38_03015 [Planctomycetota bacterium]|nr:hypothetical protein [Planctomycetota bacterium]